MVTLVLCVGDIGCSQQGGVAILLTRSQNVGKGRFGSTVSSLPRRNACATNDQRKTLSWSRLIYRLPKKKNSHGFAGVIRIACAYMRTYIIRTYILLRFILVLLWVLDLCAVACELAGQESNPWLSAYQLNTILTTLKPGLGVVDLWQLICCNVGSWSVCCEEPTNCLIAQLRFNSLEVNVNNVVHEWAYTRR
jgi:hypothetical protein